MSTSYKKYALCPIAPVLKEVGRDRGGIHRLHNNANSEVFGQAFSETLTASWLVLFHHAKVYVAATQPGLRFCTSV